MSLRSSGLPELALPDGQNTPSVGQRAPSKIFHFTEIRKRRMCRRNPAHGRGAVSRSSRHAGRAAVDADCIGAKRFAGRATVSEAVAHTTGAISVRQNRVGLAPGVCAPSLAVMCTVRPDTRITHPQGDGGNSASLPGESTT